MDDGERMVRLDDVVFSEDTPGAANGIEIFCVEGVEPIGLGKFLVDKLAELFLRHIHV